jgi:hypothetical protein
MANTPKFKINKAALDQVVEKAIATAQPQYDAALQEVVRGVRDEMEHQPAEEIYAELERRLHDRFGPGFTPNEDALRRIAEEISAGTLSG